MHGDVRILAGELSGHRMHDLMRVADQTLRTRHQPARQPQRPTMTLVTLNPRSTVLRTSWNPPLRMTVATTRERSGLTSISNQPPGFNHCPASVAVRPIRPRPSTL